MKKRSETSLHVGLALIASAAGRLIYEGGTALTGVGCGCGGPSLHLLGGATFVGAVMSLLWLSKKRRPDGTADFLDVGSIVMRVFIILFAWGNVLAALDLYHGRLLAVDRTVGDFGHWAALTLGGILIFRHLCSKPDEIPPARVLKD